MDPNRLLQENQALRERLTRLAEASVSINESLDFDVVLQGVIDSARSLTGARYGVIVLLEEDGRMREFFGSGMTPEEGRKLWDEPDRVRFFEYVGGIEMPLRLRDFHSHALSQGLPAFPPAMTASSRLSFLAVPIQHRGEHIGAVYVDEKEGDFTVEDEETLVMFASQAALVITNSRRYREEQRARADLEALIDTSPVGVVVFDAETGTPVSFNREARRMVDGLVDPGDPVERLLETLTVRWVDGREDSLAEVPFAQLLSVAETLRTEELVLTVPDGRSIAVLVNVTPMRTEAGEVESVVVTLQDMAPLQDQERMRAEFLAVVSHELRTPLTSVKGSVTNLLDPTARVNPSEMTQLLRIIDEQTDRMRRLISDLLDVARIETGELAVSPEPAELGVLVAEAGNAFRAGGGRHAVQTDLAPDLPWVMADRLRLVQVLGNLIGNAARNSPEASPIRVSAVAEGVHVAVAVSDEGRGIPAESLPYLFRKFSRVGGEAQGGDTGLGLAICRGIMEAHGGRIWAESGGPGLGARFTFTIPVVERAGYVSPATPVRRAGRSRRRLGGTDQARVLAVDDDPQALRYVRDTLTQAGFAPVTTGDPEDALRLMSETRPQLVLLDLMLPGVDGMGLMQELLEIARVPVIFLSAYGQEQLIARAFDMGATDYVVKPFSPTELAARIRAALRRQELPEPSEPFVLGDLVVNYVRRAVTVAGSPVHLTAIEYRTLVEMTANAGQVTTYGQLLGRVWEMDPEADLRPVRTVLASIRRKLGDEADNPVYIHTEPRVGYRMALPERAEPEEPAVF